MKAKSILLPAVLFLALNLNAKDITKAGLPAKAERHVLKARMSLKDMTRNLEFDFCKAVIQPADADRLDELASFLIENKYAIALRGHADAIGTYVGNWKMSEIRANAVKDYLVKKGVPGDLIVTTPFGSTLPIASNKTEKGRQKNRRVEIKLDKIST